MKHTFIYDIDNNYYILKILSADLNDEKGISTMGRMLNYYNF